MPDVEVKLNIEAQHKEALSAIQELGKALQAVQDKAKAVTDSAKSVTANTAGNKQQGSTEDVAALTKANTELARALVLVNKAAEQAKVSIAALSALQPQSPEATQMLQQAASGYERLANMAKAAADAAERFNTVGKAGLTTEEMVRQTEAAGAMVESLKKQAEELQKNISAQQEQLAALKAITAEQQKASQTRSKEQKEIERSIALRDKEAKKEEELEFRMKLSGMTRQQLAATMAELNKQMQAASAAGDKETWEKLNFQLRIARSEMEKTASRMTMNRILYAQQAQAANSLASNIKNISEGFMNMGEAAEEGSLDVAGMAGSFVTLFTTLKAGLGPIGWVMLALQGLQTVWNMQVQKEKERKKALEELTAWQKELTKKQEENRIELEAYNNSLANTASLDSLIQKHKDLNTELKNQVDHIDKITKLELHRISLSQDVEAHALAMKKDELGRKLISGDISQEDYEEALAQLQRDYDLNKLNNDVLAARAREEGASEKESLTRQAYKQRTEDFSYWTKQKKRFLWDEDRLSIYQAQLSDADATYQEKRAELAELRKEGASQYEIDAAKEAVDNALREKLNIQREAKVVLLEKYGKGHGMTVEEGMALYAKELKEMTTHLAEATRLKTEAERDLNEAVSEKEAAELGLDTAETAQRLEGGRIVERYKSGVETRRVKRKTEKKTKQRAQQLADLRDTIDSLTSAQIDDLIEEAEKEAGSSNTKTAAHGEAKLKILKEERSGRRKTYSREKNKYLGDDRFTSKEVQQVIQKLEEAVAVGDAEKMEMYYSILKLGQKMTKNVRDRKKIKKVVDTEIGR